MSEWIEHLLEDVCEVVRGGSPRPIMDYITNAPDGINWIKIGDVAESDRYFTQTKEKIIREGVSASREVVVGDLILSNSMSFGRPYILKIDGCIHDGWLRLRNDEKILDKEFLYYFLSSSVAQGQLDAIATGSVVNNLKSDTVKKIVIHIPDLATQRTISEILTALDDKIDLLTKQNTTLESLAQTYFRQWFIEGVKKEWNNELLSKYVDITRGASPRPIINYVKDGVFPWVKIGDATSSHSIFINNTKEKIIQEGISKSVIAKKGDVILSNSATCGLPYIMGIDGCVHDGWLVFRNFRHLTKWYVYFLLQALQREIVQQADGTVQDNLNTAILKNISIKVPDMKSIIKFDELAEEFISKIEGNNAQILTLQKLRDTLLPKLISGEVGLRI